MEYSNDFKPRRSLLRRMGDSAWLILLLLLAMPFIVAIVWAHECNNIIGGINK